MTPLGEVWARLNTVQALQFESRSRTGTGWNGAGHGIVEITMASPDSLVWMESGQWQQNGGKQMRFSNSFRWSKAGEFLRLEHLRLGLEHPVFLFDMAPDEAGVWRDVDPHPCRDDCYSATLEMWQNRLMVQWEVHGPKRDESIGTLYF